MGLLLLASLCTCTASGAGSARPSFPSVASSPSLVILSAELVESLTKMPKDAIVLPQLGYVGIESPGS